MPFSEIACLTSSTGAAGSVRLTGGAAGRLFGRDR